MPPQFVSSRYCHVPYIATQLGNVEVPENLPLVHADPARLTQILTELLSNAYNYTPEGGHIKELAQ